MQESLDMPIKLLLLLVGSAALAAVKAQGEFWREAWNRESQAMCTYVLCTFTCVSYNVTVHEHISHLL